MNKYKLSAIMVLSFFACNINAKEEDKNTNNAVKNSYSMQAFTGVFNTPNAEVIDYGVFGFSYSDNYFDQGHISAKTEGFQRATDLKFGVGILPNVEIVGRLGTRHWDMNGYTDPNKSDFGFRDLSGSIKWQIPFIPKDWFSLAVGGQDVGGSVVKSEAYYVTASKEFSFANWGAVRTSFGVATSDNAIGYMDGVIGSVEYQPVEYFQVAAEYDANAVNVGVKAFAPESWLPNGWDVYVSAQLYSSDDEHNERDQWFNFGVSVPLGGSSYSGRSAVRNVERGTGNEERGTRNGELGTGNYVDSGRGSAAQNNARLKPRQPGARENSARLKPRQPSREALTEFGDYLVDYGFESVSVGTRNAELGTKVVVRFENNLFNRDEREAVAVVADLVRARLGVDAVVELTNYGLIVSSNYVLGTGSGERGTWNEERGTGNEERGTTNAVSGIGNKEVLAGRREDETGDEETGAWNDDISELYSDWFGGDSVEWVVDDASSAHFVPRLILAPELASLVGTEYGAYDYQLVLSSNLQMSLWDGAVVDIRHYSDTIANSDDFNDGAFFYRKHGIREGIDRRLFHQTLALPYNVFTKFSYGRIYGVSDGLLNETRWATSDNIHRLSVLAGDFEDTTRGWNGRKTYHKPLLFKYRYRYQPLNWDIELTAGEYWGGDKGFTLRSLHWFGNTQVGIRYKKTKFDDADGGEEEDFIAFGFSIPLTFGKSMSSNYGAQVRGIEQWDYYIETSLTDKNTGNTIKTGFGKEPRLYHNLNQAYFNRDRN